MALVGCACCDRMVCTKHAGMGFIGCDLDYECRRVAIASEYAPASVLQPFNYRLLVFATIIGFLVFSELPDR